MSQTALFVAGAIVTMVVFTGAFFYAMLRFGRWADRDALPAAADPTA